MFSTNELRDHGKAGGRGEWKRIEKKNALQFEITDELEEAQEIVAELLRSGEKPVITVPDEHIENIKKNGIPQISQYDRSGMGKHYSVLAGRLGSEPYFNAKEERWVVVIDPSNLTISPRMTGKDDSFYGTITIDGRVPAESITVLGKFSKKTWAEYSEKNDKESEVDNLAA
ncbi:MAG: hypothetical protein HQ488_04935 [Parcubacteria group bacterium]|nr:hypothetical protein [Parcubacteria group bacterium]